MGLGPAHATVAYAGVRQHAGLIRSVATRQLIGQAQGILMERHKFTDQQAFALLVQASRPRNVKLRELAEQLVRSGSLTDRPARRGGVAAGAGAGSAGAQPGTRLPGQEQTDTQLSVCCRARRLLLRITGP